MERQALIDKVKEFMESEARSCSMDFGCITPEYIFRSWGSQIPIEDIVEALSEIKKITHNRRYV